ncbi:hypothetical protein [Lachnoclostridium phytofermentans]|nr:hypothetical protein [Lachnoclostridium phytofermentans]
MEFYFKTIETMVHLYRVKGLFDEGRKLSCGFDVKIIGNQGSHLKSG